MEEMKETKQKSTSWHICVTDRVILFITHTLRVEIINKSGKKYINENERESERYRQQY